MNRVLLCRQQNEPRRLNEDNRRNSATTVGFLIQKPLFDCRSASSPSSPNSARRRTSTITGRRFNLDSTNAASDRLSTAFGQAVMVLFGGSKGASSTSSTRLRSGANETAAKGLVRASAAAMANTPATNPIAQIFHIGDQTGAGGLGMMWKIFSATKVSTREDASIFFFDKTQSIKIPSKCQRAGRMTLTELMRYDATQLQAFRHSRILKILEPLKENGESLAFATEPVLGSLSDLLSSNCHVGDQTPSDNEPFRLEEMEIKCGILQITEALAFLHSGTGWLHMAVCPDNIYVTKWGSWKLAGFFFAERLLNGLNRCPNVRWTSIKASKADVRIQPNLNFLAPECVTDLECTPAADIFSLAITICTIYNGNVPLIESKQSLEIYNKQLLELERKVAPISADMGPNLSEAVLKMLSIDVKLRPSAQLFLLIKFFNDQGMLCLRLLEDVQYADTVQKVQFYCSQLKESLCVIPEKLWFWRILPRLKYELKTNPDLASAIIKPLVFMLQHCSDDHIHRMKPVFKKLIIGAKLEHAVLLASIMENVETIMKRIPDVQTAVVGLVFSSLKAVGNLQAQDAAVSCLPKMQTFLTPEYTESKLYPILREMFANAASQLQVRTLESLTPMLSITTKKAIADFLKFLINTQFEDAQVISALATFYDAVLLNAEQLGISAEYVATKMIPHFAPLLAAQALNQQQLTSVVQTCRAMVDYVSDQKLGVVEPRRVFSCQHRSETFLQVPSANAINVRPQRHSIGGGVLPQVTVTSPSSPHRSSSVEKYQDDIVVNRSQFLHHSGRKFSTIATAGNFGCLGSDNFLTPRSHPTSPHQRRHSVTVPPRPSSFTNLSHNIACMLSWKRNV